jgi:type IV pilus assembly protein PilB
LNGPNIRIGAMIVAAGKITEEALEEAVRAQKDTGKRLGEILVERGYLSELELTQILSNQLSVAWVSLDHVEFSEEILGLVHPKVVREFGVIPVHTRTGDNGERILYVAIDDPTNVKAMERVSEITGMHVRPMIAPPSEIKRAIETYFPVSEKDDFPF